MVLNDIKTCGSYTNCRRSLCNYIYFPKIILIDRTFVDEYTGSEYTHKLVVALPKVKANMSQGIPQMVEIATEKRWKEDFDGKYKKKAGKGWFRYNTKFALPVMNDEGEIIEYNIYRVVI